MRGAETVSTAAVGFGLDKRTAKYAGLSGVILGVLLVAAFVYGQRPPAGPGLYMTGPIDGLTEQTMTSLILVFATLFSISLGIALARRDTGLVFAGTLLVIFGFWILILSRYFTQHLASWASSNYGYFQGGGFLTAGLILYGIMIHRSGTFPNWLGYVGIVSGFMPVVGAFYQIFSPQAAPQAVFPQAADFAFLSFLGLFLVWVFGLSACLLRSGGSRFAREDSPIVSAGK